MSKIEPEIRWNLRWFIRNIKSNISRRSNCPKSKETWVKISRNSKNFRKFWKFSTSIWMLLGCLRWKWLFFLEYIPKLFEQDEHVTDSETSRTSFRFPSIKVFWWLSYQSPDSFQEQLFACHVEQTSFDNNVCTQNLPKIKEHR